MINSDGVSVLCFRQWHKSNVFPKHNFKRKLASKVTRERLNWYSVFWNQVYRDRLTVSWQCFWSVMGTHSISYLKKNTQWNKQRNKQTMTTITKIPSISFWLLRGEWAQGCEKHEKFWCSNCCLKGQSPFPVLTWPMVMSYSDHHSYGFLDVSGLLWYTKEKGRTVAHDGREVTTRTNLT